MPTTPVSIQRKRIETSDQFIPTPEDPQWDTGDEGDQYAAIGIYGRSWHNMESLVRYIVQESGEPWNDVWDWVQRATWEQWLGADDPTGDYLYLWSKDGSFESVPSHLPDGWYPDETFPVTVVTL